MTRMSSVYVCGNCGNCVATEHVERLVFGTRAGVVLYPAGVRCACGFEMARQQAVQEAE